MPRQVHRGAERRRVRFTPVSETLEGRTVLSTATPYLVPSNPAVATQAILTVGDSVNARPDGVTPYRMVGTPDGLGAFDNGDGTFTLLMNHEMPVSVTGSAASPPGIARAHGNAGAFVSRWTIRKSDLAVLKVEDFLADGSRIFLSNNNPSTSSPHTAYLPGDTTLLTRFCSADLAATAAYLFTDASGITYGTSARIFLSGEESSGVVDSFAGGFSGDLGPEGTVHFGRLFAFVATDDPSVPGNEARTAYELPHLGLFSHENGLANPLSQRKTIVVGTEDASPGQVYVWVGDKQASGNVVERAGLTRKGAGDGLYVVKVSGLTPDGSGATNEDRNAPLNGLFTLESLGDVSGQTYAGLEASSDARGGTQFLRPEDGQWDPSHPQDFYFTTTDRYDEAKDGVGSQVGRSRLYRLRFADLAHPELGGTIEAVLDGTEGGNMLDNLTIDRRGRILIQEDTGGQAHNGKVWLYETATDRLIPLAQHDPARFGDVNRPATAPFSQDEESTGIVDVSEILGDGAFLLNVQAHYSPGDDELFGGGQLLLLRLPNAPSLAGFQVNDGSAQRSMVTSLTVMLNGNVSGEGISAGAFRLTRTEDGSVIPLVVRSLSNGGGRTTVVLGFNDPRLTGGSLANGHYRLTIDGAGIRDTLGQSTDADGDGQAGGARTLTFHRLFGDLNGDDTVPRAEYQAATSRLGKRRNRPGYLWYLDYNSDGVIQSRDLRQIAYRRS